MMNFKIITFPREFSKWLLFPFICLNIWGISVEERGCSNLSSENLVVFPKVKLTKLWGLPLYWACRNLTFSLLHTWSAAVHQKLLGLLSVVSSVASAPGKSWFSVFAFSPSFLSDNLLCDLNSLIYLSCWFFSFSEI